MAYYVYRKKGRQLRKVDDAMLFGCNNGIMASILSKKHRIKREPFLWSISTQDISEYYQREYSDEQTYVFVVDLKPNNSKTLNLYMLTDIYGWSEHDWTPIMLRKESIFVEEAASHASKDHFTIPADRDTVYTFTYANGSVKKNKICGKWTPPGPASTNGVLLWPETMKYFIQQMDAKDALLK